MGPAVCSIRGVLVDGNVEMKIATCYNVNATAETNEVVLRMAKKFLESQKLSQILLVTVVKREGEVEEARKVLKEQEYESVILMGDDVGKTLVSFLEHFNPHMLVIGTRENSSLERLFLGSTSSYVVENSKVPIL